MQTPDAKYLKDYLPPAFLADAVDLHVDLYENDTRVRSVLNIRRNPESSEPNAPLVLDGCNMALQSIRLNEKALDQAAYTVGPDCLTLPNLPDQFVLETVVVIQPQENKALEGLYKSADIFCTQCEAEGFRNITYFPDRPDVMAPFTCTITAEKKKYPVLLSNGNPVGSGDLEDGRHWVKWEDPFKKPCYLFALVAGDLFCLEDEYITASGRKVSLRIYAEHMNSDKCDYAMQSLKKAMKWDEETFGLEYDLDIYMIVAVNDFNMGAMENKGLNVFNSKYVLARPDTATDVDFWNIDRVIAHEYFHNWTGNRVTLRNWFQLSLKEGLTVFRDQEFTADTTSRPVKRISDVRTLRSFQFPEDAGPMAHPVRPASYIKMDNFYTVTVYEKGAEVVRMIRRILGRNGFRKGMDLYFERHDSQAVTIEEFVGAMSDANSVDFTRFMRWYAQAGTPNIGVERSYNAEKKTYTMTFTQTCPATPDMADKKPMHIPVAVGLVAPDGGDLPLQLAGETAPQGTTRMLSLMKVSETFEFVGVGKKPVPSILRGFSAPVQLKAGYTDDEQAFLFANDSDEFNRWDAGQSLFSGTMLRLVKEAQQGKALKLAGQVIEAFHQTLLDSNLDKSFISHALTLPTEQELATHMSASGAIDPDAIHEVRSFVTRTLADTLKDEFETIFNENQDEGPYQVDPESVGRRSLKNLALSYIGRRKTPETTALVFEQFNTAANMTNEVAALSILSHIESDERTAALDQFDNKWAADPLVMDKWFSLQAGAQLPGTLKTVRSLLGHPAFSIKNPNKVRALIGAFCSTNPWCFHESSGEGYDFIADRVLELDSFNPMIASRLAGVFNHWRKYDKNRQMMMKAQLKRILDEPELSKNTYEIVSKALA